MAIDQKLLDSRDLPEIFRDIYIRKASGMLHAVRMKYKRCVYFRDGVPIFATSNLSEDKLGKILFTHGKVSMDQLLDALDRAKTQQKRLGAVLVEMGYIAPQDLFGAVVLQVEQVIYSMFDSEWSDARLVFDVSTEFGEEVIRLSLSPVEVVLQAVRRGYNLERMIASFVGGTLPLTFNTSLVINLEKANLSPGEKALCQKVDGMHTAESLVAESNLSTEDAYSLLYTLKILGFIRESAEEARPARAVAAKSFELADPEGTEQAETYFDPEELGADEVYDPEESLDPSPEPQAAPQQPRRATPKTRTISLETAAPANRPVSADDVKAQVARMRSLSFYQRLDVAQDANIDDVNTAFSMLRRRYSENLPEAARAQGRVLISLLSEAHRALAVEPNRKTYDQLLAAGNTPQEAEQKYRFKLSVRLFEEGKRAWEDKMLDDAETAFREAIELQSARVDYYFALGLTLVALERGAPSYEEAEALFAKATALQPDHPRGYYYLGTIYRSRGETDKAVRAYRKALSLDSKYAPATEGLSACGVAA